MNIISKEEGNNCSQTPAASQFDLQANKRKMTRIISLRVGQIERNAVMQLPGNKIDSFLPP
jgi:hypothetical protein